MQIIIIILICTTVFDQQVKGDAKGMCIKTHSSQFEWVWIL